MPRRRCDGRQCDGDGRRRACLTEPISTLLKLHMYSAMPSMSTRRSHAVHVAQRTHAGAQLTVDGAGEHVGMRVLGNAIDEHGQIALPAPSVLHAASTVMETAVAIPSGSVISMSMPEPWPPAPSVLHAASLV